MEGEERGGEERRKGRKALNFYEFVELEPNIQLGRSVFREIMFRRRTSI